MAQEGFDDREGPRLHRVQEVGLAAGLVDNKSAAIDGDRRALRFVYREVDRPR
jgi:hypothetical protein